MVTGRRLGALALALVVSLFVAANAAAKDFPVTVATSGGTLTLDERPVRIVSLSPTATEMLYAIGAGKQVIAVDDQSNYPSAAPRTKLSGFTPNVEAIATYKPDLVVGEAGLTKVAGGLKAVGIPLLVQPSAPSLADAYRQIVELGKATGHRAAAAQLVRRMKAQIAATLKSVPKSAKGLTVYHELDPTYYSATSKTFIGRVYTMLGLRNVADAADKTGSGYPQLSAEYIVSASPDLIVLADTKCCGQSAGTVTKRAGWSTIAAVENGDVISVSDDVASRWGPRVVSFVKTVAAKMRAVALTRNGQG
jgi:iron complex transport system substrate-binding protein